MPLLYNKNTPKYEKYSFGTFGALRCVMVKGIRDEHHGVLEDSRHLDGGA